MDGSRLQLRDGNRGDGKGPEMSLMAALRDLNKLNTFVRVAERRSFTKAAADLRTTPSVVSTRMRELEESLGFSLMNRSTHGIVLTDAGEGLFRNCLEMLEKIDSYVVEARNSQSRPFGTLRVLAAAGHVRSVLEPLIVEFATRHPGLRIHLAVVEDGSASLDDGFDVIIASKKPNSPGLTSQEIAKIPYVVCAAPAYLAQAGRPLQPQELRDHGCLVNTFSAPKEWPFKIGGRMHFVSVKGQLSSNSDQSLVEMSVRGCGIIRVPKRLVVGELKSGALDAVFAEETAAPDNVSVYYSKAKTLPAKTTDFLSFLRAALAN